MLLAYRLNLGMATEKAGILAGMTRDEITANLEQDYYNGQQPEISAGKNIIPTTPVEGARFEYIEVSIGGENRLCILTPATVGNGPGRKYRAETA